MTRDTSQPMYICSPECSRVPMFLLPHGDKYRGKVLPWQLNKYAVTVPHQLLSSCPVALLTLYKSLALSASNQSNPNPKSASYRRLCLGFLFFLTYFPRLIPLRTHMYGIRTSSFTSSQGPPLLPHLVKLSQLRCLIGAVLLLNFSLVSGKRDLQKQVKSDSPPFNKCFV